jgi:hypothetical protein
MEAALAAPTAGSRSMPLRVLAGTAAIAIAVTMPDISLSAMGFPYMKVDLGEPETDLPQPLWSPSAAATAPVYPTVMANARIAPDTLAFATRPSPAAFERAMPLDFLERGTERFDLAFAGVEMPTPAGVRVAVGLPQQPRGTIRAIAAAPLARLVEVDQITTVRLPPRTSTSTSTSTSEREPLSATGPELRRAAPALNPSLPVSRSVAIANEAVEAAFAGTLDLSGDLRGALAAIPARQPRAPEPQTAPIQPSPPQPEQPRREPAARAIAVPAPTPAVSASVREQTALEAKSWLDARINGVVTGSVEFRQLDGTIAIRLGSVVDMLRDRFSPAELARLRGGRSIDAYIPLTQLQAAGIPITYDPAYDEVALGVDYRDAPNAGKVQVEQIGAPTLGEDRTLIDQIRR